MIYTWVALGFIKGKSENCEIKKFKKQEKKGRKKYQSGPGMSEKVQMGQKLFQNVQYGLNNGSKWS